MAGFEWILDESKFLNRKDVKRLLSVARRRKEQAEKKGNKVAIRDYFTINLGLSTGLRVEELSDLKCGDVLLKNGMSSLIVRNGKCGRLRVVRFNGDLRKHFLDYLNWKKITGEGTEPEDPLLYSSNSKSHLTTRALQKAFKRCAKRVGLDKIHSIHHLRHTYASHLYKASKFNLRLVQKQLGHSSIKTTEVYADVFDEDVEKALERLYV